MKNVLIWLFALLLIIPWVIIGWLIYTGQIVIQFTSHQQPATIEKLVNVYNEVIIEDKLDINMKIVDKNALPIGRTLEYAGKTEDEEILLISDTNNWENKQLVVNGKPYPVDSENHYNDGGSAAYHTSIGVLFEKRDIVKGKGTRSRDEKSLTAL